MRSAGWVRDGPKEADILDDIIKNYGECLANEGSSDSLKVLKALRLINNREKRKTHISKYLFSIKVTYFLISNFQ